MRYDVCVWGHTSQHIQWGGSDDVPIPSLEAASFEGRWYSAWSCSSVTSDSSRPWGEGSEQLWVSCSRKHTSEDGESVEAFSATTRDRRRPLTEFPLTLCAFLLRLAFTAPFGAGFETGCSKSISVDTTLGSAMLRSYNPWRALIQLEFQCAREIYIMKMPELVDGGTGGGDTDARCLLRGMRQRRTSVGTWHVSSRLHAPDVPTCACALRARAVMAPGDRGALVAPPVNAMDSVAGRLRLGGIRWAASDGRHPMGDRGRHLSHRQLVACASGCPRGVPAVSNSERVS